MEFQAGRRLGPYELVSRIGAGGMGEVFRARDTRLDRSVAIKILPDGFRDDEQFRSRFEREAKTISQLNHPHICILHDVGDDGGTSYLVMELLEGESLADRLVKGPLPLSEVLRYGAEIAEALDRAHRAGVVHRDLKPGNVMLTRFGAKLLDFGLAKNNSVVAAPHDATVQRPLTQEGTIVGTFQYMAPEQLEGVEADARTDIFALGALLYEMATGHRAFEGSTRTSLIAAIVSQDPKPMSQLQPLTPPVFEHVVGRCLAKSPDDRWQSAHDVAEQLRWISSAGSQAAIPVATVARRKSRERTGWAVAAVLAIALGLLAWRYHATARTAERNYVWDVTPPAGVHFNAVGDLSGAVVVSPDGTKAVYSAGTTTNNQLWLRDLTTGESKQLAGTEAGNFPFWAPDGRRIGFFVTGSLKVIDTEAGVISRVCPASTPRGGTWLKDDTILFTPSTQDAIYRVPASGGTPTAVTALEKGRQTTHRWPWALPDGKHFLYLGANHQSPTGGENGIYVGSVGGGKPQLLLQTIANAIVASGHVLFLRDQTLLAQQISDSGTLSGQPVPIAENVLYDGGIWRGAFSASGTGLLVYHTGKAAMTSTLKWVDRSGKEISRVDEPGLYWDVELSPDGGKLAIPMGDPLREMWISDLVRHTRTRIPVDQGWTGTAVFSPDGSILYLDVLRHGRTEIVSRRVNGGGETKISELEGTDFLRGITPDGRTLLIEDQQGRPSFLGTQPGSTAHPFTTSQSFFPSLSPDGRWLATSVVEGQRVDVFVYSASDPGQKWQVSSEGAFCPRWRRDGKELYYLTADHKLKAVSLEFAGNDLTIGAAKELFAFDPHPQCRPYDVSADGQRFLINNMPDQASPNAVAVSNWMARLR